MAGNKEGGIKARDANLARDPDFYKKMGEVGGKAKSPTKGFGSWDRDKLAEMARLNGKKNKGRKRK